MFIFFYIYLFLLFNVKEKVEMTYSTICSLEEFIVKFSFELDEGIEDRKYVQFKNGFKP